MKTKRQEEQRPPMVNFPEPEQKTIFYVCDHRRCERCGSRDGRLIAGCQYTKDIEHAENFYVDEHGLYKEKPREREDNAPWVTTAYGTFTLKEWAAIERYEAAKKNKKTGRP